MPNPANGQRVAALNARVHEHPDNCRKESDETDAMGSIGRPCTRLIRSPSWIGNRVGSVKPSRGFESHPLRFSHCLQVKRESSGGKREIPNKLEPSFTAKRTATEIQPGSLFGRGEGKDSFVHCLLRESRIRPFRSRRT